MGKVIQGLAFLFLFSFVLIPSAYASPSSVDKLTDFAISKLNSVIDTAQKSLPKATEYALSVTSLDCMSQIIMGGICLLSAVLYGFFVTLRMYRWAYNHHDDMAFVPWFFFGLLPLLALLACATSNLLSFWTYVCIVHPDLYLIHLAVQKVLG